MDISALITRLRDPKIYRDLPEKVELVQTHISAIFLTGRHAYKIKKPVNFGFLDFSTLEKRKFFCHQEVNLNRRLCPQVYLGVLQIRLDDGEITIGEGKGEIIEYTVFMKQLPQDCMMHHRLRRGDMPPGLLKKIAEKIAHFHLQAFTNPEITRFGDVPILRQNIEENFSQTQKYIGLSLTLDSFQEIRDHTLRFLDHRPALFLRRMATGKIRDCHGDLHLEHICLAEDILIFDCIEFNERFRYSDVAADIAFLLMDLDFHGYPGLAAELAAHYLRTARDWALYLLLDFYKGYRAYIRGKTISFRLDDPTMASKDKASAADEAGRYFRLARFYGQRLNRPSLLLFSGLMGTGKSTLARALSEAFGWEWLRSDIIRKEISSFSPEEHRYEPYHEGIYAPEVSRQTYQVLFDQAQTLLRQGHSVILDASFHRDADRQEALALAQRARADILLLECQCPEEEIRRRLLRRALAEHEPSDGRWEIFLDQKRDFEPWGRMNPDFHLPLITTLPLEELLGGILAHLLQRAGREVSNFS